MNVPKFLKVESVDLHSDMIISEVDSPEKLKELDPKHLFIETPEAFFAILPKEDVVFRYTKLSSLPRIIKVEKLELSPDAYSMKAELSQHALFEFAKRYGFSLLETSDAFYIYGEGAVFYAKKESQEK